MDIELSSVLHEGSDQRPDVLPTVHAGHDADAIPALAPCSIWPPVPPCPSRPAHQGTTFASADANSR